MKFDLFTREREQAVRDEATGILIHTKAYGNHTQVMIFKPKATNPFINTLVRNEAELKSLKDRVINTELVKINAKQERKEQNKATPEKLAQIKVGSIFRTSWGYEQTNVNFYQVTSIKGCNVTVREIGQKLVETTSYCSGTVIAVKDTFLKDAEPLTRRVTFWKDKPHFKLESYATAYLYDGKPTHYSNGY